MKHCLVSRMFDQLMCSMVRARTGYRDLVGMIEKFQTRNGSDPSFVFQRRTGFHSCLGARDLEHGLHP